MKLYGVLFVIVLLVILFGFVTSNSSHNTLPKNYVAYSGLLSRMGVSYTRGLNLEQVLSTPRIGIVSPMAMEQAPILAAMNVQGVVNISGYEFFVGTIGGKQVVSVRSGMQSYAVTQATTIMDTFFNIQAALLSGTAGSDDPNITVGDVVLGAFVVDKSNVHYYLGNSTYQYYEDGYGGVEVVNTTSIPNGVFTGFDTAQVVPSNASIYGYGYGADRYYSSFETLPASLALLKLAENYTPYPTPISYITGKNVSGYAKSYVVSGVIGTANVWTEPLSWIGAQNALYENDAEENEGMGFAVANTHFGIPWLVIRGISDSPWYPSTYQGVWAADAAANVTIYVVKHFSIALPDLHKAASFADLSPMSNAKAHGYIVANQVYYVGLNPVLIVYTSQNGAIVYYKPDASWEQEYSYNYTPPNLP